MRVAIWVLLNQIYGDGWWGIKICRVCVRHGYYKEKCFLKLIGPGPNTLFPRRVKKVSLEMEVALADIFIYLCSSK